MASADKAADKLGGQAKKVVEAKRDRKSRLDAIFAKMPTNIKPKPDSKKVGDK